MKQEDLIVIGLTALAIVVAANTVNTVVNDTENAVTGFFSSAENHPFVVGILGVFALLLA